MLYLNSAVLALVAVVAAQSLPNKGAQCSDSKTCEWMCANGAFTVQINGTTASFVCAADNPTNTAQFYVGNCTEPEDGSEALNSACDDMRGKNCLNGGCIFDATENDYGSLKKYWAYKIDKFGGTSPSLTGPLSYDDARSQAGCNN